MVNSNSKKMAVLVGCNYTNTHATPPLEVLSGCINDVVGMRETLVKLFGFEESHIELLTDEDTNKVMPTAANIRAALNRMIDAAQPGDVLLFHYSGHGVQVPKISGDAIVACDNNILTDVDFRYMVDRVPNGASFTILSDSCFSGGLIDKEKEQIGPSTLAQKNKDSIIDSAKPKTIPFESLLQHFQSLTKIDSSDIGTHLVEYFGDDASLMFRLPPLKLARLENLKLDEGILLSGCQADELSADMPPTEESGGKSYGAFTGAVQEMLKEWPVGGFSNRQIVMKVREILEKKKKEEGKTNTQHPCLYCTDENADAIFLGQLPEKKSVA